ncbi:hypothetical protein Q5P01_020356 [Channa striata]|uniref:Uncharacterized protein n=1 Tax=Channa striata TaxID=64152 RepID=A0AA88LXL5_CHASR|nr:hypothetical protein Q5P01_020356 [Channa striata]
MCRIVVYHCETPVAESWRPSNPLPQAGNGDHGEPSADGASNVSCLSSTSKEEVEHALEVGLAPALITDANRRLRLCPPLTATAGCQQRSGRLSLLQRDS